MTAVTLHPFFLESPQGRLFALHHRPVDVDRLRGSLLCAMPFNEEMNRCRSMVALLAQQLAKNGIGTLIVDLYGTGDSEGHYVDARWSNWLAGIHTGAKWLRQQPGGLLGLLGIRLGAILAAEAITEIADPNVGLMLWQPVVDGKMHFTQFLRMRIAAQMERPELPKETTSSMRERLAAGKSLEVSGYEIHPELAKALDGARLEAFPPRSNSPVLWLEQAGSEAQQPAPASQKVIDAWRAAGGLVDISFFDGPPFWQVSERAISSSALDATREWAMRRWGEA